MLEQHSRRARTSPSPTMPVRARGASGARHHAQVNAEQADRPLRRKTERRQGPRRTPAPGPAAVAPRASADERRPLPGVDGHLHLQPRGAGQGARTTTRPISASTSSPTPSSSTRVFAYVFQGYWEDIGTIRAFFDANLALTNPVPAVQLLRHRRARLHARALPARAARSTAPRQTSDHLRRLRHHRLAHRALRDRRPQLHRQGHDLRNSIMMGADFYDVNDPLQTDRQPRARHREELRNRPDDHRQERADRRQCGCEP